MARVEDSSGRTVYSYTALGQLASRRYHIDGQAYQQSYRYNATGQLVAVEYPGGRVVDYTRQHGRLVAMHTRPATGVGGKRIAMVDAEPQSGTKTESLDDPAADQAQQLVCTPTTWVHPR